MTRAPELFRLCCRLLAAQDPRAVTLLPELERFPAFAAGWLEVGRALAPRQPAGALVAFTRAMDAEPSLPAALGRAATLATLGRKAEAAVAYEACERMAPNDAGVKIRLAAALREAGRPLDALKAAAGATRLAPDDADAWQALGVIRQDAGHEAAAQAFRSALACRPDFHEAAFNLGVALQEGGDLDAALGAYATALRLRPDSFGRIAQALVSPSVGRLWLDPAALRRELARHSEREARNDFR